MKRRKFLESGTGLAATMPFVSQHKFVADQAAMDDKELYELRTYELRFGGNLDMLTTYLKNALAPAMKRAGANHFMIFRDIHSTLPRKISVLISYPSAQSYVQGQIVDKDDEYRTATQEYDALPVESPIYTRYGSWLLHAFDGLPKMMDPVEGATVFELRTYEGYSEDAVRRKIKMFNDEEIPLFLDVELNPVFFGEMIAGPYRPCLTYMLNYRDMDAHAKAWDAFRNSPAWNTMKVKEEYAHTVSNIRNEFWELI